MNIDPEDQNTAGALLRLQQIISRGLTSLVVPLNEGGLSRSMT